MYSGRMTNTSSVSTKVRSLCAQRQLSISRLSEESGIPDKTLRRRLKVPDKFTLAELSAIANVIGADLEDLVAA